MCAARVVLMEHIDPMLKVLLQTAWQQQHILSEHPFNMGAKRKRTALPNALGHFGERKKNKYLLLYFVFNNIRAVSP